MPLKDLLTFATEHTIVLIDALALVVILIGTIETIVSGARLMLGGGSNRQKRELWLNYARWLVAGLTFQLAADILETSISSSWEAIARIAAVAVIRTFLNYFLERDVREMRERDAS